MISIIVPVLNEEAALPGFLKQFERLEGDFELIVADGGSIDGTVAVAKDPGLPAVKVINAPRGRARQMNAAAREASGEVLLFLHVDTDLPDGALSAIAGAMSDEKVAGGRFKVKLDNPAIPYRVIGSMINIRDAIFGGFTGDQAIFVRKSVFDKIGGFREIELCEDLDIARSLKKEGKVIRLPLLVTTSARRWEKSGVLKTILLMWLIRILFYAGVSPKKLAAIYADVR